MVDNLFRMIIRVLGAIVLYLVMGDSVNIIGRLFALHGEGVNRGNATDEELPWGSLDSIST